MTLLDEYRHPCVVLEEISVPDGAGAQVTEWTEGAAFQNSITLDTSMEARRAEKLGVKSLYNCLADRDAPLSYDTIFRDTMTGNVYRITSDPDAKLPPASASPLIAGVKFFTAERVELPL